VNHLEHCDALEAQARGLADLLAGADLAAPVPTCPGWTVHDVADHVGTLYRWSAAHVATGAPARVSPATLALGSRNEHDPAWFAEGIAPMLATFRGCDPDRRAWGWGAERRARFWPRRMLHETVVHRADAAFAIGREPAVEPAIAADGIDELLVNLPHAAYFAPALDELRGDDERITLRATDTPVTWSIRLLAQGYAWDWSDGDADVTVTAAAADLLLLLYNRRRADDIQRFEQTGDAELLARLLRGTQL
jgi:uncharacterized protein (TIGR03083 family)